METPFGPLVAYGPREEKYDEARLQGALEVLEQLRACRRRLDELDMPLPAAHADMAVQTLKQLLGSQLRQRR